MSFDETIPLEWTASRAFGQTSGRLAKFMFDTRDHESHSRGVAAIAQVGNSTIVDESKTIEHDGIGGHCCEITRALELVRGGEMSAAAKTNSRSHNRVNGGGSDESVTVSAGHDARHVQTLIASRSSKNVASSFEKRICSTAELIDTAIGSRQPSRARKTAKHCRTILSR